MHTRLIAAPSSQGILSFRQAELKQLTGRRTLGIAPNTQYPSAQRDPIASFRILVRRRWGGPDALELNVNFSHCPLSRLSVLKNPALL